MKINFLRIENFKAIDALQIDFNASNAVISGQNGSGKTSILDAVTWLFSGKMSDGKTGESSNFNAPDKITIVEVGFNNRLKFRRECNGKSVYFVNNVPCNATDFKYQIAQIFKDAVPALLTPFNFCRLHFSERRNILLHLFAQNLEIDIAAFPDIVDDLKTLSPEQIIKRETQSKKQLDKSFASIPARIDELQKVTVTIDVAAAQTQLSQNRKQYEELQATLTAALEAQKQSRKLDDEKRKLESTLADMRAQYRLNSIEIDRLRKDYSDLQKTSTGTCPTCGNKIPAANIELIKAKIADIVTQGNNLKEQNKTLIDQSSAINNQLQNFPAQSPKQYDIEQLQASLAKNRAQYSEIHQQLQATRQAEETQKRIEQLKAQELSVAADIALCDKKIFQAQSFIRRKIELLEEAINSHFQFVQFRMFDSYKVTEGVKEICEPFMNGVPYAALSKGEQLKASLDILQTLQKAFGVELPVFIDDAESYTSNSFVNLPNQIIRLVAVEGVKALKIEIGAATVNLERKSA